MRKTIAGVVAGCALAFAGQALAQEKLTVWWVKGFYKSEDDALFEAIKKYEDKSGVKVELSQYPIQDMIPKTVAALDAGTPPDVAYADVYDFQVTGKWAFDGKLEDISDVLDADEGALPAEHARDHVPLQRQDQEARVLRVPAQAADDAHRDTGSTCCTRPASRKATSRPSGSDYWSFWCDKVQPAYRAEDRHAHLRHRPCRWASTRATRSTRS